jgi:hypothetical protein
MAGLILGPAIPTKKAQPVKTAPSSDGDRELAEQADRLAADCCICIRRWRLERILHSGRAGRLAKQK